MLLVLSKDLQEEGRRKLDSGSCCPLKASVLACCLEISGSKHDVRGERSARALGVEIELDHWRGQGSAKIELCKLEGGLLTVYVGRQGNLNLNVLENGAFAWRSAKAQRDLEFHPDNSALVIPSDMPLGILYILCACLDDRGEMRSDHELRLRLSLFVIFVTSDPREQPLMLKAHFIKGLFRCCTL